MYLSASEGSSNIEVEVQCFARPHRKYIVEETNGTLKVFQEKELRLFPRLGFKTDKIFISIPKSYEKNINLQLGSGNCHIDGVCCRSLDAQLKSGNMTLEQLVCSASIMGIFSGNLKGDMITAKQSQLTVTSGNVTLTGDLGNTIAETKSGNMKLKFTHQPQLIKAQALSGNIGIHLPAGSTFKFKKEIKSGNIKNVFGEDTNSQNIIDISVISGNAKIVSL